MFKFHMFILFSSGTIVGLDFFFCFKLYLGYNMVRTYIIRFMYSFVSLLKVWFFFFFSFLFLYLIVLEEFDFSSPVICYSAENISVHVLYIALKSETLIIHRRSHFTYLVISKRCGEWIQFFIDLLAMRQLFLHWLYWKFESQFDFYLRNKFISEIINSKIWIKFKKKCLPKGRNHYIYESVYE